MEKRVTLGDVLIYGSAILYYVTLNINIVGYFIPIFKGQYVLLLCLITMICGYALKHNFKFKIGLNGYQMYILLFALFTLVSGLWAINSTLPIKWGTDFLGTFVMMSVVFWCVHDVESIDSLLKVIMVSGYIIILFYIFYYGTSYFISLMRLSGISISDRLTNDVMNANSLGMHAAYSIVIQIYFIIYKKGQYIWGIPFAFISLVLLAFSESRKALIIIVIGPLAMLLCKNFDNKNFIKSIFRISVIVILVVTTSILLLQLPMFSAMNERMQFVWTYLSGHGAVGLSINQRTHLNSIGIDIFKDNPVVGIGIDNAKIVVERKIGIKDYYLHNNYLEMLADGGVIGFIVYYWIHIFLISKLIKYNDLGNPEFSVCLVLLCLFLLMDMFMVSYLNKTTYFRMMIIYIFAARQQAPVKIVYKK